jgi:hypothetical protein
MSGLVPSMFAEVVRILVGKRWQKGRTSRGNFVERCQWPFGRAAEQFVESQKENWIHAAGYFPWLSAVYLHAASGSGAPSVCTGNHNRVLVR